MRKLALVAAFILASPYAEAENQGNVLVHVHKLNNNKGVVRMDARARKGRTA